MWLKKWLPLNGRETDEVTAVDEETITEQSCKWWNNYHQAAMWLVIRMPLKNYMTSQKMANE